MITPSNNAEQATQIVTKLRESEERFRSLVIATAQIVWKTDAQGNTIEASPTWCAYTGQTQEEVEQGRWEEVVHPDDRAEAQRIWTRVLASKNIFECEYRLRRYDGIYRKFSIRGVPVLEADGNVREWVNICVDVNAYRETEDLLHESERRYRHLADAMPLIVWTAQPDGARDYYNQHWFSYTGTTFDQALGWAWQLVLHPDDVQLCTDRWSEAVRVGGPYEIECRFKRHDGAYRWHLVRALPMRDQHGCITLWVGTGTDIDDQKRAEEKVVLRVRQQAGIAHLSQYALTGSKISELFDEVNKLIPHILDVDYCSIGECYPDGSIMQYWGDRQGVIHQTLHTPGSTSIIAYIFSKQEPIIVDNFATEKRFSPSPLILEYRIVSSAATIITGQGQPFGALCVFTVRQYQFTQEDVHFLQAIAGLLSTAMDRKRVETELAQANAALQHANEQLEQVNRTQSAFVSIVSHEFRTTLTSIQGFSELMRDEDFSLTEIKEYAADINVDAKRLNRMITELLDLDRMKSGRMVLTLERVDLNTVIKEVIAHARSTGLLHTFQLDLDPALPSLLGDSDKLTQVVTNLISNAVKYSPDGGDIVVCSQFEHDAVHVSVQDRGIGIPSEVLEKVFDPYYRIESNLTHYIKGTGLGLPIVRQIIQMHGGRTWAESVANQGSTFHFVIPYTASATVPLEENPPTA